MKEQEQTLKEALESVWSTFRNGLYSPRSEKPRNFLEGLGLNYQQLKVGFNSGQFHHRTNKTFKEPYLKLGMLKISDAASNAPERITYTCFGKYSVVFPMYNAMEELVNFYAFRFNESEPYGELLNDQGFYPKYPQPLTQKLWVITNPIEASSLIQSSILGNKEAIICLHTDKWTKAHEMLIQDLEGLQQIILVNCPINEDEIITNCLVTQVELEDSVTQSYLKYGAKGVKSILQDELESTLKTKRLFPSHKKSAKKETEIVWRNVLKQLSEDAFCFFGNQVEYHIKGGLSDNPTILEMDVTIRSIDTGKEINQTIDLLKLSTLRKQQETWSQQLNINHTQLQLELEKIKTSLEQIRRSEPKQANKNQNKKHYQTHLVTRAKEILRSDNLLEQLNQLLGQSGIIGEEQNRLLLFIIASSYRFEYNLHGIIQAEELDSASELVSKIADCIPEPDRYWIDLTTSRSFRYYGNSVIHKKLLVIPDYSGVTANQSIHDLKRLQSKGALVNDAPKKTKTGLLQTIKQKVKGHTSSIGACRNSKRYFEGEPKTVVVGMDDSREKMQQLMEYDCLKMAGRIDQQKEEEAQALLRCMVDQLYSKEVINPYASRLMLPVELPGARMLTSQLLNFVNLITLFHQHRSRENQNSLLHQESLKLVTRESEVAQAIELFLDAILVNVDELEAGTRLFFEQLKRLVEQGEKGKQTTLSSLQIREGLNRSKTSTNRYLRTLVECEYLKKIGFKNTGYRYQVMSWNSLEHVKKKLIYRLKGLGGPREMVRQIY